MYHLRLARPLCRLALVAFPLMWIPALVGCQTIQTRARCATADDACPINDVDEIYYAPPNTDSEQVVAYPASVHSEPVWSDAEAPQQHDASSKTEMVTVEPVIRGKHLAETPELASELALRLQMENGELTSERESLIADNARLREKLAQSEALLARMNSALESAKKTLAQSEASNVRLKQQIAELERARKQEQAAADRTLESIRSQLDDVLMRELTLDQ